MRSRNTGAVAQRHDGISMNQPLLKHVVLCADDYALNAPVSEGIVNLARAQRLSATSVMVLSPRWPQDAPALRELCDTIDVGLHLDWTSEFAQQAGHGHGLGAVMWLSLRGALQPKAVREVIERQLDAFEQHWQAPPDHVDGHQHVQQFTGVREVLLDVMQQRYGALAQRPWLRVSKVAQSDLKSRIITSMGSSPLLHWAQQHRWPVASPLSGAYAFDGDVSAYAARMQGWMKNLPTTSATDALPILMCHPALHAQVGDAIGAARACEYVYFSSPDFGLHLKHFGVQLCRGQTLLPTATA